MKMTKYLMLAGVAVALSACEKNDDTTPKDGVIAEFTTNLATRVQSRMADAAWDDKDVIGIFTLDDELDGVTVDGMAQHNTGVNLKYTLEGGKWDGGATAFRFKNPVVTPVTFKAYYPYQEDSKITGGTTGLIDGTIEVDASSQAVADQKTFDFLFADKSDKEGKTACTGSKGAPNVNFQFTHSMAKVIIELKAGTGVTFEQVQKMVPTLKGLKAKGTFSLADGKVTASDAPAVFLVLSNATEDTESDPNTKSFVAIVPPQTAQGDTDAPELSIAEDVSDVYRSAKILSAATLEAGKSYKFTITVMKLELIVESSEITDWVAGTGGAGDAVLQ